MPKYDAFGREIGEDTLASWRSGENAAPRADPEPVDPLPTDPSPAPAPPASPSPTASAPSSPSSSTPRPSSDPLGSLMTAATTARPTFRRRRRSPRIVSRLIILIVFVAVGANVVGDIGGKIQDAVDDLPSVTRPPDADAAAPVGLAAGSMLRPEPFRRALTELRRRDIGRLQSLRIAPERIDAAFLTRRTTLVNVQLRHDGTFQRFSESGTGFGHLDTFRYARLDITAPQRLVRAAAKRLGRPPSRIDYLLPSTSSGTVTWGAYFKGGAIFIANAHGRILRRLS